MAATTDAVNTSNTSARQRRLRFALIYVLPPLVALAIVLLPTLSSAAILPRLSVGPGFGLTDQHGQFVTNEHLRGEIVVYSLATVDCNDACAATLAALKNARERAAQDIEPPLRFVTLVVDAGADPRALSDFAEAHGIASDDWSVLSGDEAAVRAVVSSGFEVYLGRADDGSVTHGPGVFLVDHAGFLRAEYRTGTPSPSLVADDIGRIRVEANAGSVRGLFYDAAHALSLSCGV